MAECQVGHKALVPQRQHGAGRRPPLHNPARHRASKRVRIAKPFYIELVAEGRQELRAPVAVGGNRDNLVPGAVQGASYVTELGREVLVDEQDAHVIAIIASWRPAISWVDVIWRY